MERTPTECTIARTILDQLGGNKFVAMTGAKQFTATNSGLTFRLPSNFARNGVNAVTVTLTPADLYDVVFRKVRGVNITTVSEHTGIYAEDLVHLFIDQTGLDVTLGRAG